MLVKFHLVIGKENLKTIVSSSEIYPFFNKFTQLKGEKNLFTSFLLWIVVGGRVGYQAWQEFCYVWLELVCHKCLGQSDIWTSFNGELCWLVLLET